MEVKRHVRATFILRLRPMKMTDNKAYMMRANWRPSRGRPACTNDENCPVTYMSPKKV